MKHLTIIITLLFFRLTAVGQEDSTGQIRITLTYDDMIANQFFYQVIDSEENLIIEKSATKMTEYMVLSPGRYDVIVKLRGCNYYGDVIVSSSMITMLDLQFYSEKQTKKKRRKSKRKNRFFPCNCQHCSSPE